MVVNKLTPNGLSFTLPAACSIIDKPSDEDADVYPFDNHWLRLQAVRECVRGDGLSSGAEGNQE